MPGDADLARLQVRMDALEREMRETNSIPIAVFDAYTKLRESVEGDLGRRIQEESSRLDERIKRLEESQTWAFRMIVGAFLGLISEAVIVLLRIH